ncbi:MAG: hypothetical protein AB9921_06255 [Erysipelotrichaceae bacterium]
MKKAYIERYIYAVTKRLPLAMREDVSAELSANIQDMIAQDPENEALLLEKLRKLGHPRVLASNYRGKVRYVIGPEYYDDYINTLKVVGVIFVTVSLITGFLEAVTGFSNPGIPEVITAVLTGLLDNLWSALLTAFAWTTVGFWIAGNVGQKTNNSDWKLSDLPDLPEPNVAEISRFGTVVELIVGVSFGLIFVTLMRNGLPFFNQPVIDPLIPFFYLSIALDLLVGTVKLAYGQWRWPVVLVTTIEHFYGVIFAYVFLSSEFLSPSVFQAIADNSKFTFVQAQSGFATGKTVLIWLIVVGTILDIIQIAVKWLRSRSKA